MKEFNINRVNIEKMKLGEQPIKLVKTNYQDLKIKDGYLVDDEGDMYHKLIMDKILQEGCLDHTPRPRYIDFYENATYIQDKNIIITTDGEEIKLPIDTGVNPYAALWGEKNVEIFQEDVGIAALSWD